MEFQKAFRNRASDSVGSYDTGSGQPVVFIFQPSFKFYSSSLYCTSASYIDLKSAQRLSGLRRDQFLSGNGPATPNISSFSVASCVLLMHYTPFAPCPLTSLLETRICQAIMFLIFGRSDLYINILGFLALGLESTLPIPQLIRYVLPAFARLQKIDHMFSGTQQLPATLVIWISFVHAVGLVWWRRLQVSYLGPCIGNNLFSNGLLEPVTSSSKTHHFNLKFVPFFNSQSMLVRTNLVLVA